MAFNRELRTRAQLASRRSGGYRRKLANWIVMDWGGINREVPDKWIECLGDFSEAKVNAFISEQGFRRIASWSKLLAFAAPEKYAIYDSRVALALICASDAIGIGYRFRYPASKVSARDSFARAINRKRHDSYLAYCDYCALLASIVRLKGMECRDILAAEMKLFAVGGAFEIAGSQGG